MNREEFLTSNIDPRGHSKQPKASAIHKLFAGAFLFGKKEDYEAGAEVTKGNYKAAKSVYYELEKRGVDSLSQEMQTEYNSLGDKIFQFEFERGTKGIKRSLFAGAAAALLLVSGCSMPASNQDSERIEDLQSQVDDLRLDVDELSESVDGYRERIYGEDGYQAQLSGQVPVEMTYEEKAENLLNALEEGRFSPTSAKIDALIAALGHECEVSGGDQAPEYTPTPAQPQAQLQVRQTSTPQVQQQTPTPTPAQQVIDAVQVQPELPPHIRGFIDDGGRTGDGRTVVLNPRPDGPPHGRRNIDTCELGIGTDWSGWDRPGDGGGGSQQPPGGGNDFTYIGNTTQTNPGNVGGGVNTSGGFGQNGDRHGSAGSGGNNHQNNPGDNSFRPGGSGSGGGAQHDGSGNVIHQCQQIIL